MKGPASERQSNFIVRSVIYVSYFSLSSYAVGENQKALRALEYTRADAAALSFSISCCYVPTPPSCLSTLSDGFLLFIITPWFSFYILCLALPTHTNARPNKLLRSTFRSKTRRNPEVLLINNRHRNIQRRACLPRAPPKSTDTNTN